MQQSSFFLFFTPCPSFCKIYIPFICLVTKLFPTFCNPKDCSTPNFLSFTISQSLLKLMPIELMMPSSHLILPSIFPSFRIFSSESALHIRVPKYRSFSFSIRPSSEYSELISFKIDWFDLLAVQGTLKSFLQHHNLKASILRRSALFVVQLTSVHRTIATKLKDTCFLEEERTLRSDINIKDKL